ncbi:MAG: hypothetical protein JO271_06755 [Verrucomicrobia bacterium]|nr:hypothetical protein [Verrucomicrobiota bacterium]
MKFSENGLYIERYIKCATCGILIYENCDQKALTVENVTYCSRWCVDWKNARDARRSVSSQKEGRLRRS